MPAVEMKTVCAIKTREGGFFAAAHVTLAGNANTATNRSSERKDVGTPAAGELAA